VDPGVILEIYHLNMFGDTIKVINGHKGNYSGELPDYGTIAIIKTGTGYEINPDSTYKLIEKPETTINLTRLPNCEKAAILLANKNWTDFVKQVDQLDVGDDCFPIMNKKAGEVSMNRLSDYNGALEYYKNIVYKYTTLVIKEKNPVNDPYIYLRMLECSMKSKQYKEGIRAAKDFDEFRLTLNEINKDKSICKKEYLLGLLMVDECFRLKKEKTSAGTNRSRRITKDLFDLVKDTKAHLEMYLKIRGECPSLANELARIRDMKI